MTVLTKSKAKELDFFQVFESHRDFIFKSAVSILGNVEGADDVVQEVFLRLEKVWINFKGESKASTFIYGITKNVCREFIRKEVKERKNQSLFGAFLQLFGPSSPKSEETTTNAELLSWALAQLPDRHREPILMHFYQNMDHQQISEILQIPLGTVKSRIHLAKAKLSSLINEKNSTLNKV